MSCSRTTTQHTYPPPPPRAVILKKCVFNIPPAGSRALRLWSHSSVSSGDRTIGPLDKSQVLHYMFCFDSLRHMQQFFQGAQWLSGRVLDSRPKGRGFELHRRHCVVSLSKNINSSLELVQPRKIVSMIRKYHNHKLQTTPWHREEEPLNHHETPGRQIKQSNQLSLSHQEEDPSLYN